MTDLEQVIANLEMIAAVIEARAEQVGRLASQAPDDTQRLELWPLASELVDFSESLRKQASSIQTFLAGDIRTLLVN